MGNIIAPLPILAYEAIFNQASLKCSRGDSSSSGCLRNPCGQVVVPRDSLETRTTYHVGNEAKIGQVLHHYIISGFLSVQLSLSIYIYTHIYIYIYIHVYIIIHMIM